MLRMGSVAFLAGVVIVVMFTMIHPTSPDLMDNPVVFAVYAENDPWIAVHIGQLAGMMLIFGGGICSTPSLAHTIRIWNSFSTIMAWLSGSGNDSWDFWYSTGC